VRCQPTARDGATVEQREDGGVRPLLSRELCDRAAVVVFEARVGAMPHQLLGLDDQGRELGAFGTGSARAGGSPTCRY